MAHQLHPHRTRRSTARLPSRLPGRVAAWTLATATVLAIAPWAAAQGRSGQQESPVAGGNPNESSEVPQVPGLSGLLRGFNAGLTISGLHDASTGWATLAQPAIGYSFNNIFAIDVTVPIYMYRLAESRAANPRPNQLLVNQRGEPGDVVVGLHAQFLPKYFVYEGTVSATAPTGDEEYGLTSGRATFDFSNLFQHSFKTVTPSLEMGVGDSITLVNRLVNKNYTSLGPLAHFQLGVSFPLFHGISFQSNAYELLPVGDQKIYQSVTRRGTAALVVTGHNVTEDNGFTNSLDVPLDAHTTLSAYYSRSLRLHDDVVSFGITYVLRGAKKAKEISDEELLHSIEKQLDGPLKPPAPSPK